MSRLVSVSRRDFLRTAPAAGMGLVIGFRLLDADGLGAVPASREGGARFAPNAFLQIDTNGAVTLWTTKSEMGQGVFTSMPMLIAEELECDWTKVRAEYASANRSLRENRVYQRMATGGSGAFPTTSSAAIRRGATASVSRMKDSANDATPASSGSPSRFVTR